MNTPTKAYDLEISDDNQNQGWIYGQPVGIQANQWPRSRTNGLPMAHIWTFAVPEEYRVKGEEYVAISLFQADDHVAQKVENVAKVINDQIEVEEPEAKAFWTQLYEYSKNKHPMEIYMEDMIGGGWAHVWLTEKEFNGDNTQAPQEETAKYPGYESLDGMNAYNQNNPTKYVKLVERKEDPNVGKKLEEYPDKSDSEAYIKMHSEKGEELKLSEKFAVKTHFGGTANPVQSIPSFSPFYIEFEENFGGANMGGGNGQIDLLNDKIDWAS